MKLSPIEDALRRVGTAPAKKLVDYAEGIHWTSTTGRDLTDLQHQACADRLAFAERFLSIGNRHLKGRPPQYRHAISRFYYAMYHSARAVVFFANKGDDHQEHSALPTKLPKKFPNSDVWQNNLKNARGHRNDADYDPYPSDDTLWRDDAKLLCEQATQLIGIAKQYLHQEGCVHV